MGLSAELDEIIHQMAARLGLPESEVAWSLKSSIKEIGRDTWDGSIKLTIQLDGEEEEEKTLDPDRNSVWEVSPGVWGFRPSCVGNCIRGLVASRLGLTPARETEEGQRKMDEGHLHEPFIARWWEKNRGGYVQRHPPVKLSCGENAVVMGTMDGLWYPGGGEGWDEGVWGLEIKAQGRAMFDDTKANGPSEDYLWQMSCYWHAAEETFGIKLQGMMFVHKCRDDGEVNQIPFHKPPYTKEEIISRVVLVQAFGTLGQSFFFETYSNVPCDKVDFFCDWWPYHQQDERGEEYDDTLAPLTTAYAELGEQEKSISHRKALLKDTIKSALHGRKKIITGLHVISECQMKDKFDAKRAENEIPKLRELKEEADRMVNALIAKREYMVPGTRYLRVDKTAEGKRMAKLAAEQAKLAAESVKEEKEKK